MTEARQTRGFLFADLRDYSRFTERHGDDAAARLLTRYRSMVREAIGRFEGAEIRTEGDSFYVVFNSVGNAVNAGVAVLKGAQAASAEAGEEPIRVGIGIHAGETVDGEQGIVSSAVNIAARVCSAAGAGELLVTDTVRGLVRGYLRVGFVPVGSKKLKGIAEPVALYRVVPAGGSPIRGTASRRPVSISSTWLRRGAVAVATGLVVVVAAIIGGTLMREGVARQDPSDATPRAITDAGSPIATPAVGASPSTGELGPFPTVAEAELLGQLTLSTAGCVRADNDEVPRVPTFHTSALRPMAVAVGVRCPGGSDRSEPDEIFFYMPPPARQIDSGLGTGDEQVGGDGEVDAVFSALGGRLGLPATGCTGTSPGYGDWELGPNSGEVLCYVSSAGHAVILWSVDTKPEPILVRAVGRDDDLGQLYSWWRQIGRFAVAE